MPIVISVEREFFRIFQMLIEKGASLTFDNQNIMHIILKKKFKKLNVKKKFLKELVGRFYLIQEDTQNKLPFEYEENQQIKQFCSEIFKPKPVPKQSATPSKAKPDKIKEHVKISATKDSETPVKEKELTKRKSK